MAHADPIAHLTFAVQRVHRLIHSDLKALPEEYRNRAFAGCARTPHNIVAECGLVNSYVAEFLTTGEFNRKPKDERDAFLAGFTETDATLEYLDQQTEALLKAYEAIDLSTLGDTTDAMFGRPMTRFTIAELPAVHMMYHDGQLNFIQTLYGDGDSHW